MASQCKPPGAVQNLPKQRRNKNDHYCSADKLRKINLIHYFFRCFKVTETKAENARCSTYTIMKSS